MALVFLDDATRFGLDGLVGTSESTALFLRGLYELVQRHGLPDLIYLDHGPGFISSDTMTVVQAGLGAWLIHGRSGYPEGHGAIERFHRTMSEQLLRSLDGAADVDPDCAALTLRVRHFLDCYNDARHETLGGDTPRQRWEAGRALRFPYDEADLYRRFVVRETRRVSADHVLRIDGRLWVVHAGKSIELAELDPHANATERRGVARPVRPLPSAGVPITAAMLAYRQDLLPLVDVDGGFHDPESSAPDTHNDAQEEL